MLHAVTWVCSYAKTSSDSCGSLHGCFAGDGKRVVMPSFGAYTGGLNVRDRAIASLFGALSFTAHMLGERRIYAVPASRCLG